MSVSGNCFHYAAQIEIGMRINLFCFYTQLLYTKEIPFDADNQYFFSSAAMVLIGAEWYFNTTTSQIPK